MDNSVFWFSLRTGYQTGQSYVIKLIQNSWNPQHPEPCFFILSVAFNALKSTEIFQSWLPVYIFKKHSEISSLWSSCSFHTPSFVFEPVIVRNLLHSPAANSILEKNWLHGKHLDYTGPATVQPLDYKSVTFGSGCLFNPRFAFTLTGFHTYASAHIPLHTHTTISRSDCEIDTDPLHLCTPSGYLSVSCSLM